ncbi:MAG: DUF417 family protein [Hyphomicrobium sp.]
MPFSQHTNDFSVAERSATGVPTLAILRWSLIVIFLWFGCMKFTAYEADGIAPRDRWRRLRGPDIAFHADRPCFSLGAVRFLDGFLRRLAAAFGAMSAPSWPTPDHLSALLV